MLGCHRGKSLPGDGYSGHAGIRGPGAVPSKLYGDDDGIEVMAAVFPSRSGINGQIPVEFSSAKTRRWRTPVSLIQDGIDGDCCPIVTVTHDEFTLPRADRKPGVDMSGVCLKAALDWLVS